MIFILSFLLQISFLVSIIKKTRSESTTLSFILFLNLWVLTINIMFLKKIMANSKKKQLIKIETSIVRVLIKIIIPSLRKVINFINVKFLNDEFGYMLNVFADFIFNSKFYNLEDKLEEFWFTTLKKRVFNLLNSNAFLKRIFDTCFLNIFNVQIKNIDTYKSKSKKKKKIKKKIN